MAYLNMVEKNLTKAFKLIKDLATDAVFQKRLNSSFNFDTGTTVVTDAGSIMAKVVIVDNTRGATDKNTQQLQIMFKVQDVGDLVLYETVVINNLTWKIGKYIKSDQFISIIELFREN